MRNAIVCFKLDGCKVLTAGFPSDPPKTRLVCEKRTFNPKYSSKYNSKTTSLG